MSRLIHRCMTKLNLRDGPSIQYSSGWVSSKRGTLRVMGDALEFKDYRLPYAEIEEARLISTSQMFIPCYVLQVLVGGQTYQFGLNPGSFWKGELPFPVIREDRKMGYSWFSLIIRLIAVTLLGRFVWHLASPYLT